MKPEAAADILSQIEFIVDYKGCNSIKQTNTLSRHKHFVKLKRPPPTKDTRVDTNEVEQYNTTSETNHLTPVAPQRKHVNK